MKAQTVEQVLTAALWMIENVGWCQGSYYQCFDGVPTAFCALGAMQMVEYDTTNGKCLEGVAYRLLEGAVEEMGYPSIPYLNDMADAQQARESIIQAYRTAIKQAKQQGI